MNTAYGPSMNSPGEHGCVDDERSCFWTWDANEYVWQSRPFKGRQGRIRLGKEKARAKVDSKELVTKTLVKNKHKTMNGGQKKLVFGGQRKKRPEKAFRKERANFPDFDSCTFPQGKGSDKEFQSNKGTSKDQSGSYSQSGFSAFESPSDEGYGHSWEADDWHSNFTDDSSSSTARGITAWFGTRHTAWMAAIPFNLSNHPTHVVLDLGCTRSIGSRAAIRRFQKHALYYGITTEFCTCNKSFVFATSEMETCWESCIVHFPSKPPCSTRVDVLETSNVPISFSHQQMENWEMTIELNPKGDKITCPAFGQYSTPAECEMNTTMETLLSRYWKRL